MATRQQKTRRIKCLNWFCEAQLLPGIKNPNSKMLKILMWSKIKTGSVSLETIRRNSWCGHQKYWEDSVMVSDVEGKKSQIPKISDSMSRVQRELQMLKAFPKPRKSNIQLQPSGKCFWTMKIQYQHNYNSAVFILCLVLQQTLHTLNQLSQSFSASDSGNNSSKNNQRPSPVEVRWRR